MNPDLCAPASTPGLIASLLADTDCQATGLVERGYAALTNPGAATTAMITALMVIAVALYAYRLLLGRGLALSDVMSLGFRLGLVLLLGATWSNFHAVAYDAVARAPSRVASELVVAIEADAPIEGVQVVLDKLQSDNDQWRAKAGWASPLVGGPATAAMALNVSSFLLTLSTVGLLVVSRILLSLLLALVPVMAGFLLFDATRGLLEGWLRVVIAAALVPLFVFTLGAIELAVLEPALNRMLAEQGAGRFELSAVTPVALVITIFSLAIFASVRACGTIARGLRLPRGLPARPAAPALAAVPAILTPQPLLLTGPGGASTPVARALESAARRDSAAAAGRTAVAALRDGGPMADPVPGPGARSPAVLTSLAMAPLLSSPRNRLPRASRAASRRDQ